MSDMNWGTKIILSFIVFASGVFYLLYVSLTNETELVTDNYYEKEIMYQKEIDMMKRSEFLKEKIFIDLNADEILIKVSDHELSKKLTGEIYFYRTNDSGKDFTEALNLDNGGIQKISSGGLSRGLWKIKMNLHMNSETYFFEKNIFLE